MASQTSSQSGAKLNLLFIRHGETQDNIDRILQGHRDTSLTPKGIEEAKVLAQNLKSDKIHIIYHSPLTRMLQTIEPILSSRPDLEHISDPDLRGQSLGTLEGESYDKLNMSSPRSAEEQFPDVGVELFDDFVKRLKKSLGNIIGIEALKLSSDQKERTVVIATHGVCITSLFRVLLNREPCDGFNGMLAEQGPEAYEVRWTDSDDVARVEVRGVETLPITNGELEWEKLEGVDPKRVWIERWGKREKAE
ncbi:Broad-specificity phosphatase [Pseudocercospora fuligena]|uniref:Broad-specificity phosphatase n=1 Tax=Pseudocercospora fuligena TaxID=685502 RepID=A0A8H6R563_9PEZI|nr:Broad-specificity phosphatase [Pseudocercospora fuligena]